MQELLKRIKGVIFDLDGSLVDSMWIWKQIDVEYLGKFGIPLPEGLQEEIEGLCFSETAQYFRERFQIPDPPETIQADWNRMAWDKYEKEVPLKPGAAGFLRWCREKGIRLGIATSNSRELVENVASVHGLRDYFTCIMTGCDVAKGKPAPDVYLAAAEGIGVKPADCLVFEDIVPGILAGKAAGMTVCAVEDDYSLDRKAEKAALADYYIRDFTEIERYLI